VRALEGVFPEARSQSPEGTGGEELKSRRFQRGGAGSRGARSEDKAVRTVVPHELERVEEEDEDQIARQEQRREQQEEDQEEEGEGRAWET
jgi:hypothetical protein